MGFKKVFKTTLNIADKVSDAGRSLPVLGQIDLIKDTVRALANKHDEADPAAAAALHQLDTLKATTVATVNDALEALPPGAVEVKAAFDSKRFVAMLGGFTGIAAGVIAAQLGVDKDLVEKAITAVMAIVAAYIAGQSASDAVANNRGGLIKVKKAE